jgi:nondiscriminating glutamyl-tRNA synthetase
MARAFDPAHLGRSPARFDEAQLNVWQKEAAHRLPVDAARSWLRAVIPPGLDDAAVNAFITAVLPNVVLPEDARPWVDVVFGGPLQLGPAEEEVVRNAGSAFFSAAAQAAAAAPRGSDLQAIAGAVRAATGKKGAELYMPLRVALTGRAHGPELAPLLKAMPAGKAHERLARFGDAGFIRQ